MLSLRHPIERGIVTDWDGIEKVWLHAYSELGLRPGQRPVLLSEAILNPKANKEKMAQVLFEALNVPAMSVVSDAVLSLYAAGRTTGLALGCGEGVSHSVPIVEGYMLPQAAARFDWAGRDLTEYLARLLRQRGYNFVTEAELELVRDMKEKLCFVPLDFDKKLKRQATRVEPERSYKLPDGQSISLDAERFQCAEALFHPMQAGLEFPGIHQALHDTIQKCDVDIRRTMYLTVMLSGGSTLFPNMVERLSEEIWHMNPKPSKLIIVGDSSRHLSAWNGGAVLASLAAYRKSLVSKAEYDECGPAVVHWRCP